MLGVDQDHNLHQKPSLHLPIGFQNLHKVKYSVPQVQSSALWDLVAKLKLFGRIVSAITVVSFQIALNI